MWFILFSLSPCTAKDLLFESIDTEISRTLNKTKSTASSQCTYISTDSSKSLEQNIAKKQSESSILSEQKASLVSAIIDIDDYYSTNTNNSPPKYILYKRLKIALNIKTIS